jgi:hypothetical protein
MPFRDEWDFIVYRQMSKCSAISWREKSAFWCDDVLFVLDQHAEYNFHSAGSLNKQSAGRYVVPLGHIIWSVVTITPQMRFFIWIYLLKYNNNIKEKLQYQTYVKEQ